MPRIDSVLRKYDLKTLESLVERRRREEEKELALLLSKRKRLEVELRRVSREVARELKKAASAQAGAKPRRPNARRLNDITLGDAIEKVLRRAKGPVHYRDLTDRIHKQGLYRTRSKNLLSTIAVTLKRDARFVKVEPGLYRLRRR